ncbi:MAG TPA: hypothetical protein VNH18_29455 [Bryobacteraceae bacterium]|nr:hypothetical protein [Blastocatellia bacterium]HXJ43445.1 hypothetical protein [Bryobacteraceae bacterium]
MSVTIVYMLELTSDELDTVQAAMLDYEPIDGVSADLAEVIGAKIRELKAPLGEHSQGAQPSEPAQCSTTEVYPKA